MVGDKTIFEIEHRIGHNYILSVLDTANFFYVKTNIIDSITITYLTPSKISYKANKADISTLKAIIIRQLFLHKEDEYILKNIKINTLEHGHFVNSGKTHTCLNKLFDELENDESGNISLT